MEDFIVKLMFTFLIVIVLGMMLAFVSPQIGAVTIVVGIVGAMVSVLALIWGT